MVTRILAVLPSLTLQDVISATELLSIHRFVEIRFVLPWSKITAGVEPGTGSFFALTAFTLTMIMHLWIRPTVPRPLNQIFELRNGVPSFAA